MHDDLLRRAGIRLRNTGLGERKTTCPRCSAGRAHRADPCLSVKIEPDHVLFRCHHCDHKGLLRDGDHPKGERLP